MKEKMNKLLLGAMTGFVMLGMPMVAKADAAMPPEEELFLSRLGEPVMMVILILALVFCVGAVVFFLKLTKKKKNTESADHTSAEAEKSE